MSTSLTKSIRLTFSISLITTTASTASSLTAMNNTDVFYPPAASSFALSVPAIIGIVFAGVGFLVLLAVGAALAVCLLDRKKKSPAEKEERKREKSRVEEVPDAEDPSATSRGDREENMWDENADLSSYSSVLNVRESAIGPRYARMIGVDTIYNTCADSGIQTNTSPQITRSESKRNNKRESERMVVHLPVHVGDLGAPRQSQIQYERKDPGDEDRDGRGYRKGASSWHPEL